MGVVHFEDRVNDVRLWGGCEMDQIIKWGALFSFAKRILRSANDLYSTGESEENKIFVWERDIGVIKWYRL